MDTSNVGIRELLSRCYGAGRSLLGAVRAVLESGQLDNCCWVSRNVCNVKIAGGSSSASASIPSLCQRLFPRCSAVGGRELLNVRRLCHQSRVDLHTLEGPSVNVSHLSPRTLLYGLPLLIGGVLIGVFVENSTWMRVWLIVLVCMNGWWWALVWQRHNGTK